MDLGGAIRAKLHRVVRHHALVAGDYREGVGVGHRGHTANAPLAHSQIGILLGGVPEDSIEPFHILWGNTRTEVTASEHRGQRGGESHLEGYVLFAHHGVSIIGVRPYLTGDRLRLVGIQTRDHHVEHLARSFDGEASGGVAVVLDNTEGGVTFHRTEAP